MKKILFVILSVFIIAGCTARPQDPSDIILGKWRYLGSTLSENFLTFRENGKSTIRFLSFDGSDMLVDNYFIEGQTIRFCNLDDNTQCCEFEFELLGDTLILRNFIYLQTTIFGEGSTLEHKDAVFVRGMTIEELNGGIETVRSAIQNTQPAKTEEKILRARNMRFRAQLPAGYNTVSFTRRMGHGVSVAFDGIELFSGMSEMEIWFYLSRHERAEPYDAVIVFFTAPKEIFDFDRYISQHPAENILYRSDNSFVALEGEHRIIFFKHLYSQDTHIIFSNILCSWGDLPIVKKQFALMQSLSVE
jgi:hypothetical protein